MTSRYNPTCHVPGWVIVSAVRYARGRATYIVGMTVDMLIEQWPNLTPHDQLVILRDLEAEHEYRHATQRGILSQIDDDDWHRAWVYCSQHAPKEWKTNA